MGVALPSSLVCVTWEHSFCQILLGRCGAVFRPNKTPPFLINRGRVERDLSPQFLNRSLLFASAPPQESQIPTRLGRRVLPMIVSFIQEGIAISRSGVVSVIVPPLPLAFFFFRKPEPLRPSECRMRAAALDISDCPHTFYLAACSLCYCGVRVFIP